MIQAPDGIQTIDLKEIKDLATNIDPVDQPSQYALRLRGGRIGETESGYIFRRDFGTKKRMTPPTGMTLYDAPKDTFFDIVNGTNHEIIVALDSGTPKNTRVFVDTSVDATGTWKEMTAFYAAKINGLPGASSTFLAVDNVVDILGVAVPSFDVELFVHCVIFNADSPDPNAPVYGLARVNSATIAVDHIIGSTGLAWEDNDNLTVYFDNSLKFTWANGNTPHIRFKSVESQRKTTMLYGDSSTVPVGRYPLQIYRRAERKYFYTAANTALFTLQDAWYAGQGGAGLCKFFANVGTPVAPVGCALAEATETKYVYDFNSDKPWMKLTFGYSGEPDVLDYMDMRLKVTLLYANYQESDPIFASCQSIRGFYLAARLKFEIDFSLMNKEIVGIIIYGITYGVPDELSASNQQALRQSIGDDNLVRHKTIYFDRYDSTAVPTQDNTKKYHVAIERKITTFYGYIPGYYTTSIEDSTSTLLGSLNHAPKETRVINKPLYAVRASRQQGAIDVIMPDSATLLFSNFSGAGNFEDDNYPDVRTSADDNLQKIFLSGHGEAMGMSIDFNKVLVFRRSELEVIDIYDSGERSVLAPRGQNILALDCIAKKSIIVTDSGTYWAGTGYIYFYPKNGSPKPINQLWKNWYDGTLKNSAGVSHMTDTEKANILAGYDPTFREVWFQMYAKKDDNSGYEYICWRYSEITGKWNQRVLGNNTKVVAFSRRSDNTMTVISSTDLMKYPNMIGAGRYKDIVLADDSGGYGIETLLTLNIGGINKIVRDTVFWGLVMDHYGVSSGSEKMYLNMFANRDLTAFHSSPYRILIKEQLDYPILAEPIGEIFAMRLQFYISSSDIGNVSEFDIYGLKLGFIPIAQIGL